MSEESKIMSLRLGVKLADQISAVARTDDMAIAETIRAALRHYIAARCADPEFRVVGKSAWNKTSGCLRSWVTEAKGRWQVPDKPLNARIPDKERQLIARIREI